MDNLSRDVFGNVSFTKQLKENKSFSDAKMKTYRTYDCVSFVKSKYFCKFINFDIVEFKISLN